jgi:hypothetical protein
MSSAASPSPSTNSQGRSHGGLPDVMLLSIGKYGDSLVEQVICTITCRVNLHLNLHHYHRVAPTAKSSPAVDLYHVRAPGCYSRSRQVARIQGQCRPSVALLVLNYCSSRCP